MTHYNFSKTKVALVSLILIYLFFSLKVLCTWTFNDKNTVTGDEPHYLIMADGLINQGTLEQTIPYQKEFQTRKIFKAGLAPFDAKPSPKNAHVVEGPHGLYNIHNIGLPIILSLPFFIGGIWGAKISMLMIGCLCILMLWCVSGVFNDDIKLRFLSVFATCIAFPLIPCSNQIYPDIFAGIIALSGMYWFMTLSKKRSRIQEVLWSALIAFLPWLQIKLLAPCCIILIALMLKILSQKKDKKSILMMIVVVSFSFGTLLVYNHYAFGKYSGPYESGALVLNKTSFMVFLGLLLDQNQGVIFQNPLLFVGVFSIGALFRYSQSLTLLCGLVFLSLIVPNAMHVTWYGGVSFFGRFGWSAAIVFMLPTVFGLLRLADIKRNIFHIIIVLSLLLQTYFFYKYSSGKISLYHLPGIWFDNYSLFYFPLHSWMPVFYDSRWAYSYLPNYTWLIFTVTLLILGCFTPRDKNHILPKYGSQILIAVLLLISASRATVDKQFNGGEPIIYTGKELPSQIGTIEHSHRVAFENVDKPGYVTFGPYIPLRKGGYQLILQYRSTASLDQEIGTIAVVNTTKNAQLKILPLYGTAGKIKKLQLLFNLNNFNPNLFEFRNYWNGSFDIQINNIEFKRAD